MERAREVSGVGNNTLYVRTPSPMLSQGNVKWPSTDIMIAASTLLRKTSKLSNIGSSIKFLISASSGAVCLAVRRRPLNSKTAWWHEFCGKSFASYLMPDSMSIN